MKHFFLVLVFFCFSCGSKSSKYDSDTNEELDKQMNEMLIGKWQGDFDSDGFKGWSNLELIADSTGSLATFQRDGSIYSASSSEVHSGIIKWKLIDNVSESEDLKKFRKAISVGTGLRNCSYYRGNDQSGPDYYYHQEQIDKEIREREEQMKNKYSYKTVTLYIAKITKDSLVLFDENIDAYFTDWVVMKRVTDTP